MTEIPPQNLEAEENVLGAMLVSPKAIDAVIDLLEPGDFYRESHSVIFRTIVAMHAAGDGVDVITLANTLEQGGLLETAGGKARLHELARIVPATANVRHWAGIIREDATLRGLIYAGMEIQQIGQDGEGDLEDRLSRAAHLIGELSSRGGDKHDTLFSSKDVVARFREKMENPETEEQDGIPAPWSFIPTLRGSRLYVLAAYTADGKSVCAIQFLRAACEVGRRVGLASNEMSTDDLTARLIATFGVPHHMCQTGRIAESFRDTAVGALGFVETWDFNILDDESLDVATLRRYVRMRRPDLLIVDHLHRMKWKERRDLEEIIREITNISREFDIPVLLLAQLKRSGDWKDPFPRPNLTMLKETSVLEQEAWSVWFVWRKRDEFFEPGTEAEFFAAKNRGGSLGHQRMRFVPSEVRFEPVGLAT